MRVLDNLESLAGTCLEERVIEDKNSQLTISYKCIFPVR